MGEREAEVLAYVAWDFMVAGWSDVRIKGRLEKPKPLSEAQAMSKDLNDLWGSDTHWVEPTNMTASEAAESPPHQASTP